jgi:glycosyltransferase involved in cell wall biosynthesis
MYPDSTASPRVRIVGFRESLRAHDVELSFVSTLTSNEYARLSAPGSTFGKMRLVAKAGTRVPWRTRAGELRMVHRLGAPIPIPSLEPPARLDLYDFDDALYLGSIGDANRLGAPLKREAARWRAFVRRARTVIAGNAHLASRAREETNTRVEVIPSCINPDHYRPHSHEDARPVTLGWIGSSSTAGYLTEVLEACDRLGAKRRDFRLLVVGGAVDHSAPWLEVRPWSPDRMAADIAEFDIGLMPLPNTEWARGKCGYKLLQYFAAAVPAIASPVGVAPALIGSDRGLLAATPEEWVGAIEQLAGEAPVRTEVGANGRALVARDYSYSRWAPELASLMKELA